MQRFPFGMASFAGLVFMHSIFGISPSEALDRLSEGNLRYVQDRLLHPDRNTERREAVSSKQNPFAVIVGCSDSRVPPEIVFDQGVGDLFVVRVAGNVVGPVELDSIEYAIKYLGASLVVILGHERCGAVQAVVNGQTADIEAVSDLLSPAVEACKKKKGNPECLLTDCIQDNAKYFADRVSQSPLLAKYISEKQISILPAYYDLDTGSVCWLK